MKIIIILFLFISFHAFPQMKSIQGIIKDSDSNSPLQYANVLIKGTSIGTTTDLDGRFVLSGKFLETDTLLISFVGYKNYIEQVSILNEGQVIIELQKNYFNHKQF